MKTVYRFDIPIEDAFVLQLPFGAKPLHVAVQERAPHAPSMWVLVDTEREPQQRYFLVTGTGNPLPSAFVDHIGSFQDQGFVWHVWETLLPN